MFRRSIEVCAWAAILAGTVVFFGGWVLDVTALKNVIPGTVVMKASTASALVSVGASLLLLRDPTVHGWRRAIGISCAVFPLAMGLAFLSEFVLGLNLRIDEFPFRDAVGRAQRVPFPGRLAPTTAVNFVLVGLGLLLFDRPPRRGWRPAEVLAVPVALVASMSLIGYIYSIPAFYGPGSATKMAVNTAVCFLALATGLLLARPHGRLMALVTTTAPGGMMARRLFPFVVLLPLMLGWLRLKASDAGVFGDRVGTWWLTAATIVGMVLLIWRGAARLNRADEGRKELEGRLYELANHDQMTGLFNRHRFEEEMVRHAARVRRHGGSTTLMMLDLDGLKQVNDHLGHEAGDALIKAVSGAIASRVRKTDVAGRLGGDEFGFLLLESTPEGATKVAESLLVAIRSAKPDLAGAELWSTASVEAWSTASIGVAYSAELSDEDGHALLAEADEAMYEAKRAGGNRVMHARSWPVDVVHSPDCRSVSSGTPSAYEPAGSSSGTPALPAFAFAASPPGPSDL